MSSVSGMSGENRLLLNKHVFVYNEEWDCGEKAREVEYIRKNFCGRVVEGFDSVDDFAKRDVVCYIYGDISKIIKKLSDDWGMFFIIKELSVGYEERESDFNFVSFGEVPLNVAGVGVFFPRFFVEDGGGYFQRLKKEHEFQKLTESNKGGTSYRNGIYITKVEERFVGGAEAGTGEGKMAGKHEVDFKLLRCSTNLDGPTDNFRETDTEILKQVNGMAEIMFEQESKLNHVLAQIYNNGVVGGKEKKAKIKGHSDKTKDMPRNGLMAFCTFYDGDGGCDGGSGDGRLKRRGYDLCYRAISVYTRLRFKLKKCISDDAGYERQFDVMLYPNSVFMMALDTNRLYTHEICPSILSVDMLPTRLGYVVRCSNTEAVFKDGQTYVRRDGKDVVLERPTEDGVKKLKETYYKENSSEEIVVYDDFDFSLNDGDYVRPLV